MRAGHIACQHYNRYSPPVTIVTRYPESQLAIMSSNKTTPHRALTARSGHVVSQQHHRPHPSAPSGVQQHQLATPSLFPADGHSSMMILQQTADANATPVAAAAAPTVAGKTQTIDASYSLINQANWPLSITGQPPKPLQMCSNTSWQLVLPLHPTPAAPSYASCTPT